MAFTFTQLLSLSLTGGRRQYAKFFNLHARRTRISWQLNAEGHVVQLQQGFLGPEIVYVACYKVRRQEGTT